MPDATRNLADMRFEDALRAAGAVCDGLRDELVRPLDEQGFVVALDVLDAEDLVRVRQAFAGDGSTEHVRLTSETPHLDVWLKLSRHSVILEAAWHVLRRPFRIGQLHGRNPLPGYGQQGLHTDWPPRMCDDPFEVVTIIAMFDDFTADNGPTRVVPRSHLRPRPLPKTLAQPLAHHPEETIVTGKAGSALIFNGHLLHSGTQNRSRGPRRAAQISIVDRTPPRGYVVDPLPAPGDPLAAYFFGTV